MGDNKGKKAFGQVGSGRRQFTSRECLAPLPTCSPFHQILGVAFFFIYSALYKFFVNFFAVLGSFFHLETWNFVV